MRTAVPLSSFVHRQHVFDDVTGLVRPSIAIGPSNPATVALHDGSHCRGDPARTRPIGRHAMTPWRPAKAHRLSIPIVEAFG
jgi:hypothetical protein